VHLLRFEKEAWDSGCHQVAGADEAGRGPLAGPVVVASVSLSCSAATSLAANPLITDSKTLSSKKRAQAYDEITQIPEAVCCLAVIESPRIDEINILQATHEGFRQVLAEMNPSPDFALIDGRPVPDLPCPAQNIIKGDAKSLLIGAASILAKVTRDRIMIQAAETWPEYGFEQHMGYGTAKHLSALREHGPCPIHRRSFRPVSEAMRRADC
jgi:ribonuclease HII